MTNAKLKVDIGYTSFQKFGVNKIYFFKIN